MTITCPMCQKSLQAAERECSHCHADLSLMQSHVTSVSAGLEKADALRRDGQLAPAVQAYLEILDTDPANAEARAALGPVLRALRAPPSPRRSALLLATGAAIAAAAFAAGAWFVR